MPEMNDWDVDNQVVWREKVGSQIISLNHPNYPATTPWDGSSQETLKQIAAGYLSKVEGVLDLPSLFKPGTAEFGVPLAWLKLPLEEESALPDECSSLIRYTNPVARSGPIDRSLVFVASEVLEANNASTRLGSRLGLMVMSHLSPVSNGWLVHITGVARSFGLPAALGSRDSLQVTLQTFYSFLFTSSFLKDVKTAIPQIAGLEPDQRV